MAIEVTAEKFPEVLNAHGEAVNALCMAGNPAVADERIAAWLAEYRGRYQKNNEIPAPADVVAQVRARYVAQYDDELRQKAATLTTEHQEYGRGIEAAIEAARILPHLIDEHPNDDMKAIRHLLELERAEKRVDGLTRAQLADLYIHSTDARDRTLVALIERDRDRLVLRDDPDHDAIAMLRLRDAIEARQAARVPQWLRDAQAHHAEIRTLHFDHLRKHLLSDQRAIAGR